LVVHRLVAGAGTRLHRLEHDRHAGCASRNPNRRYPGNPDRDGIALPNSHRDNNADRHGDSNRDGDRASDRYRHDDADGHDTSNRAPDSHGLTNGDDHALADNDAHCNGDRDNLRSGHARLCAIAEPHQSRVHHGG
jgi:hypothetical protein